MELKLAGSSRNQLERNTKDLIGKLASVLTARATRFNGMFHLSAHLHTHTYNHQIILTAQSYFIIAIKLN